MLEQFPISVPSLSEQVGIAQVLSSLDDKIDLLHRQNKTLETMAETLFRKWFVVEASEDWNLEELQTHAKVSIGRTPPRKEFHWFTTMHGDAKWVSIKDLADSGLYVLDTTERLTWNAVEAFNIPVIPRNTVILSFKMTVGRVAITSEEMTSNEAIAHFVIREPYSEIDGTAHFSISVGPEYRGKGFNFSQWYPTYDWVRDDGYENFADWVA